MSNDDATTPESGRAVARTKRPQTEIPKNLPDRYQLKEVLGAGGMGEVFRAHDTVLGRDVAVKILSIAPGDENSGTMPRDRFVREAKAAARLAHPNIVAVHDADPDAGWLVMDLVEGEALKDIAARGPLSPKQARGIAEQVLAALDAAHASGVIHRDIKPSNIIVDKRGKVTLVDFGVARLVDAEVTRTGESLGTPAYMAPEQLRGSKTDARTDLYGLAATLFEIVSGERMIAFETPTPAALAHVRDICGKEHGLGQVITRCLQAAPEARVGSAREAIALLSAKRKRWPVVVGALAVLAMLAGGAFAVSRMMAEPGEDPRKRELFAMSQRGEHHKAELLWKQYVTEHPHDADAQLMLQLTTWWVHGRMEEPTGEIAARLRPMQRDMLHGIALMMARQEAEAIAFLEHAEQKYPTSVEIVYALGEARWHGQQLEKGVQTLERAFSMDARWQIALHHVFEYRLSRGESAKAKPYVDQLRTLDPARSTLLDCEVAIADKQYARAAITASNAFQRFPHNNDLYACAMAALVLSGNPTDAFDVTIIAEKSGAPIDLREFGLPTYKAELLLYQGRLADYLAQQSAPADRQKPITLALWQPSSAIVEAQVQTATMARGQPIVPISQTLFEHVNGRDPKHIYEQAFEAEVRAFGRGLSAKLRGDLPTAVTELRRALDAPAKGDARMLIAHQLATVLHAQGDTAGAKGACAHVLAPSFYQPYRAALVPDCALWSEDTALWTQLDTQWKGEFQHPSIVEIRRRLAGTPTPTTATSTPTPTPTPTP